MEKLLLVEDDSALVQRLTEYLSTEGFHCVSAGGQPQAVAAIDAERPDLVLVDITLAEGNGFAVCAYTRGKGVPVIFLTASGDELSTVTGLDMGADDYIAKPSGRRNWFRGSAAFCGGLRKITARSRWADCGSIQAKAWCFVLTGKSFCLRWSTVFSCFS